MLKMPGKMPPKEMEKEEPSFELGLEVEPAEEEEPRMLAEFSLEELEAELAKRKKEAPAAGKEAVAEEEMA
jgi:hypothetical protein